MASPAAFWFNSSAKTSVIFLGSRHYLQSAEAFMSWQYAWSTVYNSSRGLRRHPEIHISASQAAALAHRCWNPPGSIQMDIDVHRLPALEQAGHQAASLKDNLASSAAMKDRTRLGLLLPRQKSCKEFGQRPVKSSYHILLSCLYGL